MLADSIALTPPQVAKQLAVNVHKIHAWIAAGQLRAINLGDRSRPRWRILPEDLEVFLSGRAAKVGRVVTRRRPKQPAGVIEFF